MSINVSEVIWTIINFVVLFCLLNHFLFKPIFRVMDARKARIQDGLEEEAQAKSALDACEEALQQELAAQHQQAKALLAESRQEAQARSAELCREARTAAQGQKQTVTEQIAQEKTADYMQIQAHLPELVAMLADRMLQDAEASAQNQKEIEQYVKAAQAQH